ncbi:hypothetical protein BCR32DRAFT_243300 [Anaeromyces robustus]|uniref:Cyclin N-terminal domain-containing protein n=1 Tax=Anaeromyces robustus TaxID=1754192 RepID=A0A1Y1XCX2_9FUNG|nr:hypothetical protein BCR32DRAFT_243300 [Anaeromyces robustus]|eukprot:ORX83532.1 hypothetical protein BCR32DRAFT_243300 [Anaeromyces robustus]
MDSEPIFHSIPINKYDIAGDEERMNEMIENSIRYKTFNKNEVKYLYHSLIDNCIYFLKTSYESIYDSKTELSRQEYGIYIEDVIRKARITIPLLYGIMFYIKRFRQAVRKCPKIILGLNKGLTIKEPKDLKKVFIISAILSLKFFNDRVILNTEWTKFLEISTDEINLCENQFLKFINYNLHLNSKNYYVFINDYLSKFNSEPKTNNNNNNNNNNNTSHSIDKNLSSLSIQSKQDTINDNKINILINDTNPNTNNNVVSINGHGHGNNDSILNKLPTPVDPPSSIKLKSTSTINKNKTQNIFLSITPTPSNPHSLNESSKNTITNNNNDIFLSITPNSSTFTTTTNLLTPTKNNYSINNNNNNNCNLILQKNYRNSILPSPIHEDIQKKTQNISNNKSSNRYVYQSLHNHKFKPYGPNTTNIRLPIC